MNKNTLITIRDVLEMDDTLTMEDRVKILKAVKNFSNENALDRCVPFAEAANVLGKSRTRVQQLVASGVLEAVRFPGLSRASGVRESSLRKLIGG